MQELVSPYTIIFLTRNWQVIGHKGDAGRGKSGTPLIAGPGLNDLLASRTGIPETVLCDFAEASSVFPAEKLSWMEGRNTTREEDMSYSLLGIFGIQMPLIYGEGEEHARRRLMKKVGKLLRPVSGQFPLSNGLQRLASATSNLFEASMSVHDIMAWMAPGNSLGGSLSDQDVMMLPNGQDETTHQAERYEIMPQNEVASRYEVPRQSAHFSFWPTFSGSRVRPFDEEHLTFSHVRPQHAIDFSNGYGPMEPPTGERHALGSSRMYPGYFNHGFQASPSPRSPASVRSISPVSEHGLASF